MTEQTAFESRIGNLLKGFADGAPVEVDASALSSSIAQRGRRTVTIFGSTFVRPRWLTPVAMVVLLIALLFAAVAIGARLLLRETPTYPPLSIAPTAFMAQQRSGASAVRLRDGRVLIAGGHNGYAGANVQFAEIFDPTAGTFEPTGDVPPHDLQGQSASLLADGRVLITGGYGDDRVASAAALVYDPDTGSFADLPNMVAAREAHAAIELRDGRTALIGGLVGQQGGSSSGPAVEYFDPYTLSFSPGPSPAALMADSLLAFPIDSHRVLVFARGSPFDGVIFDVSNGAVEPLSVSVNASEIETVKGAAMLDDGSIAIALGRDGAAASALDVLTLLNPRQTSLSDPSPLPGVLAFGPVTLSDGRLLFGFSGADDCGSVFASVFNPSDGSFSRIGQIGGIGNCSAVSGATTTALADGGALIAGGHMSSGQETSAASIVRP